MPTLSTLPLRKSSCHNSTLQLEGDSHPSREGKPIPLCPTPPHSLSPGAPPWQGWRPWPVRQPPGVRAEPASGGRRPTSFSRTRRSQSARRRPGEPAFGLADSWALPLRFLPSRWPSDGPAWRGLAGLGAPFPPEGKEATGGPERRGGLGAGGSPDTTSAARRGPALQDTSAPAPRLCRAHGLDGLLVPELTRPRVIWRTSPGPGRAAEVDLAAALGHQREVGVAAGALHALHGLDAGEAELLGPAARALGLEELQPALGEHAACASTAAAARRCASPARPPGAPPPSWARGTAARPRCALPALPAARPARLVPVGPRLALAAAPRRAAPAPGPRAPEPGSPFACSFLGRLRAGPSLAGCALTCPAPPPPPAPPRTQRARPALRSLRARPARGRARSPCGFWACGRGSQGLLSHRSGPSGL